MITNTKVVAERNNESVSVYFLNVDGNETMEPPMVENKELVSKEDFKKYGKVHLMVDEKTVRSEYFLKRFRGGRPGEILVDPYGMFAKGEDLSAFTTQRGHRFCEYVRVTEQVYNTYVSYLKTRDSRYFRAAEKVILDMVV